MSFSIPTLADLGDAALAMDLQHAMDNKAKRPGALGQLEVLAVQLGMIQGTLTPTLQQPQLLVFAGDHGLAAQGVSSRQGGTTAGLVDAILSGGAAVSVLARQHGLNLTVVDCGLHQAVSVDTAPGVQLTACRVAAGTADSLLQPAMSLEQCHTAFMNGQALVAALPGNVLLLGDVGIGNSAAASLIMARMLGLDIAQCTTPAGLDDAAVERKRAVLARVLQRHAFAAGPMAVLTAMGGFEIATMVGAVLQAAQERRVVVVDGFTSSVAVMVAQQLAPQVTQRCVFAHQSGERNHATVLEHLQAQPLLSLGLHLGEGAGAALAWPLLVSACQISRDMVSLA